MAFGLGSQVGLPLVNKSGNPLNGFEVAQNVAEVLAYDTSIRYIGMAVYCIDEGAVYRFKSGITDSDFVIDSSSVGIAIVDDYSALPTSTIEQIAYCKSEYIDTTVIPNVTYSEGFYLYDLDENKWIIASSKVEERYPLWKEATDYEIDDTVSYNNKKYRCIVAHASTTFVDDDAYWIECKEVYYSLTKEKYDDMVTKGLITEDNAYMYIITNAEDVKEPYALWEVGIDYVIDDTVTYDNKKYRCIADHTSADFVADDSYWIECKEVYYVLTKEKYEDMFARGLITEDTADMYIITNADECEETSAIYENYSLFPTTLSKEIIVYAKNDYEDVTTSTKYKKGFYIYKLDTNTWELIGSSEQLEVEKEEDTTYIETVIINDVEEEIEATRTVQKFGLEETVVIIANEDSSDGSILAGSVISIKKIVGGLEFLEYYYADDVEIVDPFA